MSVVQSIPRFKESPDAILGKNLVIARLLAGVTQQELASSSGVSRATIAQLETGSSDPRLSTVVDLATALHLSPIVLLGGASEVVALARLPDDLATRPVEVPPSQLSRMQLLLSSGLLGDRGRAARIGATIARSSGDDTTGTSAAITAGIFSAFIPGAGTAVGAALGRLLENA